MQCLPLSKITVARSIHENHMNEVLIRGTHLIKMKDKRHTWFHNKNLCSNKINLQ